MFQICLDTYSKFKCLSFLEIARQNWSSIHCRFVLFHSLNLRQGKSFVFIEFFHTASSANSLKFQKSNHHNQFSSYLKNRIRMSEKMTWITTFQTFSSGIMSEIIRYTATRIYSYTYLCTCIKRNIYSFPYLISSVTFLSNV